MTRDDLLLLCAVSTPGSDSVRFVHEESGRVIIKARESGATTEVHLSEESQRALAAWLLEGLGEAAPVVTTGPTPEARLEALKAAEAMLETIAPKQNARGYSDGALNGSARVAEVLRLAAFLLGGSA